MALARFISSLYEGVDFNGQLPSARAEAVVDSVGCVGMALHLLAIRAGDAEASGLS